MPMVHMSLDVHCHEVDSTFLFAITAAAVVPSSDPKSLPIHIVQIVCNFGPLKSVRIL